MESTTMPTSGLGSTAETNRLLGGQYFNPQTGAQIQSFTPSNTNTTITTDIIGTQPFKLPPVSNTTTATGLTGLAAGIFESDKILQDQQAKAKEASLKVEKDRQGITDTMTRILGLQAGRAQAEEDAGINQMSQDVNRANQAYLSSQRAEVNEMRALDSQPGLSPEGKAQAQSAIQRKYAFENADNAFTLSLARQDLATAENILNKKYELQMEPLKTILDYQKFVYQENKEDMTKAQEREFQTLLKQNERDYNFRLSEYNNIGELALMAGKNGAPASLVTQISNAPTRAEALRLASGYALDPLDRQIQQAQLANLYSQINERNTTSSGEVLTLSGKPQNATQASANGYADRLAEASVVIDTLGSKFVGSLAFGGILPNALQSGDRQVYEQAKTNFVTAILRRESGAAISPTEFKTAEGQYFPQAGDKPDVIAQKERARNTAINNLYREANVPRPVLPGQIIESGGKRYRVEMDGETLTPL